MELKVSMLLNAICSFVPPSAGPTFESESSIRPHDEFELMKNLCEVLFQQKRYPELQRVAFSS